MILRTSAVALTVSLLSSPTFAATPPKAAKPTASTSAPAQPAAASAEPAAKKKVIFRLPGSKKPAAVPPPPAELTTSTAQKPAAQQKPAAKAAAPAPQKPAAQAAVPAAQKPATEAKATAKPKVAKKTGKKKQVAGGKGKNVKQGRAALAGMEKIDKRQLATDHLSGAENKSTLELLVSYKETLRDGDLETAGVLLRLIANETPSREVATVVNDLIGVPLNTQDTEVLIEIARADRADAVAGHTARKGAEEKEKVPSPLGERIHAAHAAMAAAPRTSRIDALAAYKHAVAEGNKKAATVALSGVVQGPLDEETVNTANALLEVENIIAPGPQASVN